MIAFLQPLFHDHDIGIITVAALLCGCGAWVTTGLFNRFLLSPPHGKARWLAKTALIAGTTVWCTHFIAMLGYRPGVAVGFSFSLTTLSLLIALTGSLCGTALAGWRWGHAPVRLLGGAVMGLGIASMHYVGMLAYRVQGSMDWNIPCLVLSVALATGLAAAAFLAGGIADQQVRRPGVMTVLLMLAIISLHFTGMLALHITPSPVAGHFASPETLWILALVTAGMAGIIVLSGLNIALMDHRNEREHKRLLHMIDDMPVAVMTVEPDTLRINYANTTSRKLIHSIEHLLPVKAENLIGTCIDIFHRHPEHQRRILANPANLPHNARISLGNEILDLKISAINDNNGQYLGPMLTWALVTKEVEAENRILHLARYDSLTGLANRNTFHGLLDTRLQSGSTELSLLFIDLDGFKLVNDTHGHRAGDTLLRETARRLQALCDERSTDACRVSICRLGGDEFVIMSESNAPTFNETLADTVIRCVEEPYRLGKDLHVRISASVGIALCPQHGTDSETLLSRADIALYAAKDAGKNAFKFFADTMEQNLQDRLHLEDSLREALITGENLFVFYQPIVNAQTNAITAREALIRWYSHDQGWISPAVFIPVAEQTGLIERLGHLVLHRACRDAAAWPDEARVAVNISAAQLGQGSLEGMIAGALDAAGLPATRLEIEVTETALVNDESRVMEELHQLRAIGVHVALDDFGTGYSSLSHIRSFPFDKIKIDGSFVRDSTTRPDCAAVVRAIADIGHRLGVTTVAEGVETQEHLDAIRAEGCQEIQGYVYARPEPEPHDREAINRLNAQKPKPAA
ncbi:EAL domain-containing protein [Acetobacter suratthaniensis]|uniref:EAL domain-containing protein n=1 Tax=Acetobacter suratthaniensis TaxID=1502841 RepID=A0ABS3LNC4_9PROT|nr:EAL domain-containing protein [Acetobacter suratthaniensis]MCX2566997.1 EAL domain-containing protein [Acetobacter suratthaniensis]